MTPTDLRDAEHANSTPSPSPHHSPSEVSIKDGAEHTDAVAAASHPVKDQAATFPGELLRAAREKSGLSMGDVATRLRMAVRQVEALEKADYTNLPSGTFLRGFVRNYAKVVHADPARAILLLEQTHSSAMVSKPAAILVPNHDIKINIGSRELASPKTRIAISAGVLVLLACAAWYWWEFIRPNLAEGGRAKPVVEVAPAPSEGSNLLIAPSALDTAGKDAQVLQAGDRVTQSGNTELVVQPIAQPNMQPMTQPTTAPSSSTGGASGPTALPAVTLKPAIVPPVVLPTQTPPSPSQTSAATPRTAGTGTLGFTFSGDSWVEVTDSTGKTILSRRYKAGDVDEAAGRAPFSVVIGKAGATRMAYNGKEIDLTPHTKLAVARVTVK